MTAAKDCLAEVDGCVREADRRVRALTFLTGTARPGPLLAVWPPFAVASARVLDQLGPPAAPGGPVWGRQEPGQAAVASVALEAEPDLVAAATLLERAGQLLGRRPPPATSASARCLLATRVWGVVWVGAHVVAGSIRDQPQTYPGPLTQIAHVEDHALTALQHAGRHCRWPTRRPTPPESMYPGGRP